MKGRFVLQISFRSAAGLSRRWTQHLWRDVAFLGGRDPVLKTAASCRQKSLCKEFVDMSGRTLGLLLNLIKP